MRTVAVVDYGMGNLRSVSQAVQHVAREASMSGSEVRVVVTSDPAEVHTAERVVLPGQGAMRCCTLQRTSRCSECVSACRCCSIAATKGPPKVSA
jgi:imidazoleglycerol phosphate synthase glutamine amidotransferase subunit HisH